MGKVMLTVISKKLKMIRWIEQIRSFKTSISIRRIPLDNESAILSKIRNPYLAARTEWNFLYNDILKGKRNWQLVAITLLAANILLIIGLSRVALKTKFVPYVTKVDTAGNAAFGGFLSASNQPVSPLIMNAFVRRYIENVRSVIADPVAEKKTLDDIYATTRGESLKFINSFYHDNDPFKRSKNLTVEVQIKAALQKSSQTWQVDWTEVERNLEGDIINQARYEALVTIAQYPVTNQKEINVNPLGLYTTRLSWSQQL
jgi:type IV secretory pathway TrbF-like protein